MLGKHDKDSCQVIDFINKYKDKDIYLLLEKIRNKF